MTARDGAVVVLFALLVGVAGVYVARNLRVGTGIAHFAAAGDDARLAELSARIADSELTRTMILSVGAPEPDEARRAVRAWAAVLRGHPEVERLSTGPPDGAAAAVRALYLPRRHAFLSSDPERDLEERLSDSGLRRAARALRLALAAPEGALLAQTAPADPFMAFPALLQRLESAAAGGADVRDGQYVTRDGLRAVLFLATVHSAFDGARQSSLQEHIEASFRELDREHGGRLTLERSGVHRFAAASEGTARAEMTWLSSVSLAGIVALFAALFRSARLLLLSLLPLAAGVLAAAALGLALFGELHVLTLVFGATLIGVCIDYPIHYLSHHTLVPAATPRASLARVGVALALGALTTVAGFSGLAASELPGVRELGVFASAGVLAALAVTAFVLPASLPAAAPRAPRAARPQARAAAALRAGLAGLEARPRATLRVGAALVLVVAALGLSRLTWQDDVFALGVPLDVQWLAEDARVRAGLSRMDAGRFVAALGPDEAAALERNDAVYARLARAREAGLLADFRSLHELLPSPGLQERSLRALRDSPELAARVDRAFTAEGFRPGAFAPFARALADEPPLPLRGAELAASPLGDAVRAFVIELGGEVAVLTYLRVVGDPERLAALLADLPGVHYFDQQVFLAEAYGRYRQRTLRLVAAGLVAVLALLYARYRRVSLAAAAAAPALIAAGLTLALLAGAGVAINLLHLLGLLLVLSFGVDYAVFLLESRHAAVERGAALLGLCVACASTCLSFGLLSASSFPALRALGMTTGLGVVLSLALAPASVALVGAPATERERRS